MKYQKSWRQSSFNTSKGYVSLFQRLKTKLQSSKTRLGDFSSLAVQRIGNATGNMKASLQRKLPTLPSNYNLKGALPNLQTFLQRKWDNLPSLEIIKADFNEASNFLAAQLKQTKGLAMSGLKGVNPIFWLLFTFFAAHMYATGFHFSAQAANLLILGLLASSFFIQFKNDVWIYGFLSTVFISLLPLGVFMLTGETLLDFIGYSFVGPLLVLLLSNDYGYFLLSYFIVLFTIKFPLRIYSHIIIRQVGLDAFAGKILGASTVGFCMLCSGIAIAHYVIRRFVLKPYVMNQEMLESNNQYKSFFDILAKQIASQTEDSSLTNLKEPLNNMIELLRLKSNPLENNPTPINIYKQIGQLWNDMSLQPGEIGLDIPKNIPSALPIDSQLFNKLVRGLVDALKESSDGGTVNGKVQWLRNKDLTPEIFDVPSDSPGVVSDNNIESRSLDELHEVPNLPGSHDYIETAETVEENGVKGVLRIVLEGTGENLDQITMERILTGDTEEAEKNLKTAGEVGLLLARKILESFKGGIKVSSEGHRDIKLSICLPIGTK